MNILCLRFDVDSHRCLDQGVPALLELLDETNAQATFFVNMGRLTSRPRMLGRLVSSCRRQPHVAEPKVTLPLSAKLGPGGIATVVLRNPRVGAAMPDRVSAIATQGSEVGLHGGHSHRRWQDDAAGWLASRATAEMRWGLDRLADAGVTAVHGFSSPGWTTSPVIAATAASLGLTYLADDHGHGTTRVEEGGPLPRLSTNLVGEPGGVGYLEWHRALGHTDAEVEADFRARLADAGDLAVMYDHPFHAGIADLALLRRLIDVALDDGWRLRTMAQVVTGA